MKGRVAYQAERVNLKSLYSIEELLDFIFRKIDDLIASIGGCMTDDN